MNKKNPKGAGRPKGSVSEEKKLKIKTEKYMKMRIMRALPSLLNSQMSLARGCSFLYVIKTETNNKGVRSKQKPELIKDKKIIENYLAGDLENEEDEYYYITTDKPDNKALDSLEDRAFGRAHQNIGDEEEGEGVNININLGEATLDKIDDYLSSKLNGGNTKNN